LHSPEGYRAHLKEVFARAGIPVHFAPGAVRPDPAGRAFVALLECAAEGLSARKFAEYLSLGQVPDAEPSGAAPEARSRGDLWVTPDAELISTAAPAGGSDAAAPSAAGAATPAPDAPVRDGQLRAPRRWERLLVLDLLIKARDFLRNNEDVRHDLQSRFSHFFIDEFQDTDPLQAEILLLLAADDPAATNWRAVKPVPGKLLLVGDPKQSIYRFRRADVTLYEDVKRRLVAAGAEVLHLSTSFRAPPSIQRFVNDAFAPAIGADAEASGYVALEQNQTEIENQLTVIALPVPTPYGDFGRVTDWSINESLPGAVGAFVAWLVNESGWTVEEKGPDGKRRSVPVQPRHIAILFRRFHSFQTDMTRPYVRALEARRIPHVLVGGRSFHDREEIMALRNAVTAIEWPDDELKVFATLRGPFFALSDEALLAFRNQINADGTITIRHLNPVWTVDHATLDPMSAEVADALSVLRRLHFGRNSRPIAETITMFLQAARAHAGIALWQNGEQALANCQRLVDKARRFERRASSFRAFVESLEMRRNTERSTKRRLWRREQKACA
jgi:ATP-dependent helicase/nuclease subunit A